jgi:hypothetical protein
MVVLELFKSDQLPGFPDRFLLLLRDGCKFLLEPLLLLFVVIEP